MERVESVPEHSQDEALWNIEGINVFDATTLEKGVVQQINESIKVKEATDQQKKIDNLLLQTRVLKNSIEQNEKAHAALSQKSYSEAVLLKLKSLKEQKEKCHQQLKLCENKLIKAQFSQRVNSIKPPENQPGNSLEKEDEYYSLDANYDWSSVSSAKSLKERKELIKRGLATPFSFVKKSPAVKFDDSFVNTLVCQSSSTTRNLCQRKDKLKNKQLEKVFPKASTRKIDSDQPNEAVVGKATKLDIPEEDDYVPSKFGEELSDEEFFDETKIKWKNKKHRVTATDDANPRNYKRRIEIYKKQLLKDKVEGYEMLHDKVLTGGLKVPGKIWERLYKYQQTGVKWLWELHTQQTGGILGDEMGLGKTIQIIAFLSALSKSKIRDSDSSYSYEGLGPVLIVTPTTVMHQWVREIHTWAPMLRVAILHSTGSHKGLQKDLISNIVLSHGILITSYERVRIALDLLLAKGWHYVILDEGHKIRNPEAEVTHSVKMFPTPHRLILSGSPIQNHLRELWSLFDFVFPGKLGTLPVFMEQFSVPIIQGGYSNASEVEVQTAYKCACTLRSTIAPYLLRRMKQDVQSHIKLPEKSDQILFCSLTDHQIEVYQNYLNSDAVNSILSGRLKVFVGLIQLRKICNHPDLYTGGPKVLVGEQTPGYGDVRRYGFWKRSGKLIVVESLLRIWKKQGKKVLLFTQSKLMLNVLEDFVKSRNYTYLVMHGGSSISSRQPMVNQFNEDPDIFVFILTTRVGGLGVNLIGADRVVIYDPDWNPSTDAQAQERAWRIGQKKQVTIYRLLTTGTIEEKIYHRQIFKHFVSNRILKDPKQRRFFKANDMHELFAFIHHKDDDPKRKKTETAAIFAGTGSEVKIKPALDTRNHENASSRLEHSKPSPTKKIVHFKSMSPQAVDSANSAKTRHVIDNNTTETCAISCNQSPDTQHRPSRLIIKADDDTPFNDTLHHDRQSKGSCSKLNAAASNLKNAERISPELSTAPSWQRSSFSETNISESFASASSPSTAKPDIKSTKLKNSFLHALQKFKQSKKKQKNEVKKRRRLKHSVDGEKVENVIKKSKYKQKNDKTTENLNTSDDYVLAKLFSKGVHSAMKHTTIMESSTPDYALVEAEANRVAKEAVKNIRLSRKQYKYPHKQASQSNRRFGKSITKKPIKHQEKVDSSSGEEDEQRSFSVFGKTASDAKSSSTLLMQMRKRNHIETLSQDSSDEDEHVQDNLLPSDEDKLLQLLVDFIASQPQREATTAEVMAEFEKDIPIKQAPNFRAMLHQVCEQSTIAGGESKWILKSEFC